VRVTSDIRCVTMRSRLDNEWGASRCARSSTSSRPKPEAKYVLQRAYGGYTINTTLADLLDDVVLALKHDGRDLEPDGLT